MAIAARTHQSSGWIQPLPPVWHWTPPSVQAETQSDTNIRAQVMQCYTPSSPDWLTNHPLFTAHHLLPMQHPTTDLPKASQSNLVIQAKTTIPDREAITPTEQSPNTTGLPDRLKAGLESLSGYSMDHVKVHYNSTKPAELNALAYTQGQNIHVGQGQEQHLPHEGWHVVQQMQGRVQPTMQARGMSINDNQGLEHEADVMGARASRRGQQLRRQSTHPPQTDSDTKPGDSQSTVIQRAIGLEIESSSTWSAYSKKDNKLITGQHLKLYSGKQFRMETELSGKLEFVIEPPAQSTTQLVKIVEDIQAVVKKLIKSTHKTGMVTNTFMLEFLKQENPEKPEIDLVKKYENLVSPTAKLIDLQTVFGKQSPEVYISRGSETFNGGFQATVGVHLSALPMLFENIQDIAYQKGGFPSEKELKIAQQQSVDTLNQSINMGLPLTQYHVISPEMEGLLHLIYYYIAIGSSTSEERRPFPKGLTQIMAKTNYAQMFSMTPEAKFFALYPSIWVKFVTDTAHVNPEDKIFQGTFGDPKKAEQTIDVTYREWLLGMVGTPEEKGKDVLSVEGGGPEILKTMGELSRTDDLGVEGESSQGVIVELRGLDHITVPVQKWDTYAARIGNFVDKLNTLYTGNKMQATQAVFQRGKGSELFWSFLSSEQEAGEDISAMAVEALNAPFQSQIEGLIKRAQAKANEVLSQRG